MPKVIKFKQLHLISFTGHDEITVDYGDITKLSGKNGEGKSSIGTAPVWIKWGVDLSGAKFNPSPTDRPFERVFGSILLSFDGTDVLLAREIVKGSNKFYINEVPQKATEFDAFVATLFDKEQFLSLYNPGFFFTQHWQKQREQVMKHVTPPSNKEVFQAMSRTSPDQKAAEIKLNPQAERLEEELKKLSIADLEKKYADLKNKNDKWHTQAQGSVKTLSEQLAALGHAKEIDREALEAEIEQLDAKVRSFDVDNQLVMQREFDRQQLHNKIELLIKQIRDGKEEHTRLKEQEVKTHCHACEQELTEEAKTTLLSNKKVLLNVIAQRVNDQMKERDGLKLKLEALIPLDPPKPVAETIARIAEINSVLQAERTRAKAALDLEKAKQSEADFLKAKNDSIFVLDAIKAFKAKEAELQVSKVQALFTTLSVRLFDYVKSSDTYTPAFVIQMNGKDYPALSVGEKISAGLELSEVLYKQSELIVPTFVDGIGEYTGKVAVYGQLITGRAVPDQLLKIESEDVQ
ncbi:ATPase [Paenibacillus sedimenti]|uniref:ATPase n=1 Tax=Paenibacillus sedimenti TaxID=2770274 RepID=A0A926KNR8_9BACL|nr:ATPase [Paenibacillus sedimenti]MBD0381242.1 ATPase [Paenibacillus sedimenti]